MPRRIDVELTSARDDGTWTWRAAGARQPKGVLTATLLYEGAKVGDVVTAEADFDIDGITITSITPPRAKAEPSNRIEITGSTREFEPVITTLVAKGKGAATDRGRDRGPRRDAGDRGPRPGGDRAGGPGGDRGRDRGRDRDRGAHAAATRDWRGKTPAQSGTPQGGGAKAGPGQGRPQGGPRRERTARPQPERQPAAAAKPRPKRLSPANTRRAAVLESLSPEERPVAEQVLRGGIPAVRRAIADQNAQARAAGTPEIPEAPLLGLAEQLLPKLKTAEWHDRAEAAMADVDEIGLRDLRSVVSSADAAARDDETRALASSLREALERRIKEQQDAWVSEITAALGDGRLVRALRVASRPPEPSMRFPADLAMRLSSEASEAMAADTPAERWGALLEAVAASPVRTTVKPAALPADAPESLLQSARQQAGRIPALTTLLGISMPPPPGPPRRIPPKPQRPPQPSPAPAADPAAPPETPAPDNG